MTIVEVMAALVVAAFVLLGTRLLLDQLVDSGVRMQQARDADARESNGQRVLEELVRNAQAVIDTTDRFGGDARSIELSTRCSMPAGWIEPCHAQIAIDSAGDSSIVFADLSTGEHLVLRRTLGHEQFRFVDPALAGDAWLRDWSRAAATLPRAVMLVGSPDTIVFATGAPRD
jgi:hypothetical protein